MHKFLLLLTFFVMTIEQNQAQQLTCRHTFAGELRDSITQKPIAQAKISLVEVQRHTISNQEGNFDMEGLCAGSYTIKIEIVGYQTFVREVSIPHKENKIRLLMQRDLVDIEEVAVTRIQREAKTLAYHVLNDQQKAEGKGKTLSQQLAALSGVTTLTTGSTIQKPVINGLHSQRVLVLNHGIRQEGQQWGAEHAPEIDPFTAGNLEVSKGAQAVRYGADALAGVVLVTPDQIDTNRIVASRIDLIGQSNGRGLTGNMAFEGKKFFIPKLAWRLQASTKQHGNIRTASYYLGNTAIKEANFSGLFHYPLKKGNLEAYVSRFATQMGIFQGAHAGSKEDIMVRIANGRPFESYGFSYAIGAPKQEVSHTLAKLKYVHNFSNASALIIQYGFQQNHRQEFDVRRTQSDETPMADMLLTTQSLDAVYSLQNYKFGLQGSMQVNNNVPGTGTTPIIPNFDNHTIGSFAIAEFYRNNFLMELGLRYDYRYFDVAGYRYDYLNPDPNGIVQQYLLTDQRHFHNLSGTAGISYPLTEKLLWKSNAGLAWRAPSANELYSDGLHHGSGTYEIGNRNLKSEKGFKWVNHLAYETARIQIHTDLFIQYIADYIYANPNPDSLRQTIRGTFPVFTFQQDPALFYGFDAAVKLDLIPNRLAYNFQFSIVHAKNTALDSYLPYIPSDRMSHSVQWNIANTRLLQNNFLKISHQFVARQKRYEASTDYVAPPPEYHLLALYAGSTLPMKHQKLSIQVAIENLTNTLYKDYMDRFRYYAHQQGRNFSLRLSYNF